MHQKLARTLQSLASLTGQHTARTNAAEGSATLRKRRQDQEHVDEYLQARLLTSPGGTEEGEQRASRAEHHR